MNDFKITSAIGTTPVRIIALCEDVDDPVRSLIPFAPTSAWRLLLTAKKRRTDTDAQARFQLASEAGIAVDGSNAICALAYLATASLKAETLVCDVRATNPETGESNIVARGTWELERPATHGTEPAIPIFVLQPYPGYVGGGAQDSFRTAVNADGGLDFLFYNFTTATWSRVNLVGAGDAQHFVFSPL